MSPGCYKNRRGIWLATWLAGGIALAAYAGPQGEKIQFSDPGTRLTSSTSNLTATLTPGLNRLNPTPNAFKQVQDDLFKPLANSINSGDSMQGVTSLPAPPQQHQMPTKRAKELMELHKNWAFADLNDLYPEQTMEDAAGIEDTDPNKRDKNPTSLIEKYFNNLGQKNVGGTNRLTGQNPSNINYGDPYASTNSFMSRPFAPDVDPAKALFSPNGVSDNGNKDVAPGLRTPFYAGANGDEVLAAQKRTADFRRILDNRPELTPNALAAGPSLDPYGIHGPTVPGLNSLLNPFSPTEAHRNSINPALGFTDPTITALHNRTSDDPTASALGMPNPISQIPVVRPDPIKASQRMLDPYGSIVSRPRF